MKKTVIAVLVVVLLMGSGCSQGFSESADDALFAEREILFDSDGDGVKSDLAVLSVLGGTGGYGQHRLEVYENGKRKIFDSTENSVDVTLIAEFPSDAIVDSIYSVEVADVDGDGCDELVCRQYAWVECHADHLGDIVSVFKVVGCRLERIDARLELENKET